MTLKLSAVGIVAIALGLAAPGAALAAGEPRVTYTANGTLQENAGMNPGCDTNGETPCFVGSASATFRLSGLSSAFDPIAITGENKVSGAFVSQASRQNMAVAASYQSSDTYYDGDFNGVTAQACSASYTVDPATPPAIVRVLPSGPRSGLIVTEAPRSSPPPASPTAPSSTPPPTRSPTSATRTS